MGRSLPLHIHFASGNANSSASSGTGMSLRMPSGKQGLPISSRTYACWSAKSRSVNTSPLAFLSTNSRFNIRCALSQYGMRKPLVPLVTVWSTTLSQVLSSDSTRYSSSNVFSGCRLCSEHSPKYSKIRSRMAQRRSGVTSTYGATKWIETFTKSLFRSQPEALNTQTSIMGRSGKNWKITRARCRSKNMSSLRTSRSAPDQRQKSTAPRQGRARLMRSGTRRRTSSRVTFKSMSKIIGKMRVWRSMSTTGMRRS
mmetsp:Transcript_28819/g.95775  ORF Transcript_28819/g.95775 Transcript_28819/m.95775 type:complete len:255 (-) Transcript_28819:1839-2603(-)